jgi:hypothetical protein
MGIEDLSPASTLTFDQYDQVLNAALHGQGIALGRMSLAGQYVRSKRLVPLFGREQRLARGYHAVFARNAEDRREAREFVEWIRARDRGDAGYAARSCASPSIVWASAAATAALKRNPCISSQRALAKEVELGRVSTPSATTLSPRLCPRSMMARTMAASSALIVASETNARSIFSASRGSA